jgi:signal transduction histidine kinase
MTGVYGPGGAIAVLAALAGALLHAVNSAEDRSVSPSFWLMQLAAGLAYGMLAVVLRRRATRALRATVTAIGLCSGLALLSLEWATTGADDRWVLWLGSWLWAPGYVAMVAVLPALLPDGRLVSPRWRPVLVVGVLAVLASGVGWAITPYQDQDFPGPYEGRTNPVGVEGYAGSAVSAVDPLLIVSAVLAALAALVVRWRRSTGVERQQLKWILLGLVATVLLMVLARLAPLPLQEPVAALAMLPLPGAIAVAALRYGLWEVEVVISRTLVHATVSAAAVAGYVGSVWLVGLLTDEPSTAATLVVVAALAPFLVPLHTHLQRRVNRWVHGDVDEPLGVLHRLGDRLAAAADPADLVARVLPDVLVGVRRALRAGGAALRLEDGTLLVEGHPEGPGEETAVLPLEYAGEVLGTLAVSRTGGFGPGERQLLDRLAAQASVAVHTVLLSREAQRSRELVVLTREEERRRLRRDLHDGVGPSLAALALQVETARDLTPDDPAAAVGMLGRMVPQINAVVGDVRALVHELRPPTLDELGLGPAVRELAGRLSTEATRVRVDVADPGELPAAVEVAAYRIVGEAVTNAVRHAGARDVRVTLRRTPGSVEIRVVDDGSGLREGAAPGLGLASMRARAEELGGALDVSSDGAGTTLRAALPVAAGDREPA